MAQAPLSPAPFDRQQHGSGRLENGPARLQSDPGKLENGLTYYVRENQKPEGRALLRLVLNVGSLQEEDDEQGLAHFLEHMAFKGTKTRTTAGLEEESRESGVVRLHVYKSYWHAVGNLLSLSIIGKVFF